LDISRLRAALRYVQAVVDEGIRCTECKREIDELTAIAERWPFWSDGRHLLPYCPTCSKR
jgi:hypothetical protein